MRSPRHRPRNRPKALRWRSPRRRHFSFPPRSGPSRRSRRPSSKRRNRRCRSSSEAAWRSVLLGASRSSARRQERRVPPAPRGRCAFRGCGGRSARADSTPAARQATPPADSAPVAANKARARRAAAEAAHDPPNRRRSRRRGARHAVASAQAEEPLRLRGGRSAVPDQLLGDRALISARVSSLMPDPLDEA